MATFLIKTLAFILVALCLLFGLDFVTTKGLKKNKSNLYLDWNRIFNGEIKSNLIINGSSIAEGQISPSILDSILHVDSYNFGLSGFSFFMQQARYRAYLEHNTAPKIIVQIVGDATLQKEDGLFQIEQFLPYLNDSIIQKATKNYEGFDYWDYHIPFLRYVGRVNTVMKGFASYFNVELLKSRKYKGYAGHDLKWNDDFYWFQKLYPAGTKMGISDSYLMLLDNFVKQESANGRIVILVFPPTYFELKKYILNRDELIKIYKSVADKNNVLFLDYSESEFSKNRNYFYNATHLNRNGSELFTKRLAVDIKARI